MTMSLDYIVHCDNWAQIPHGNVHRGTVHGLRNAIREAKRTLARSSNDEVCRLFLPKSGWLSQGEEVAAVRRTPSGFTVSLNPRAGVRFHRVA